MAIDISIPSVGESVQEAFLAEWLKQDGDRVAKDEPVLVIETDKVTLEVNAAGGGVLTILVPAGGTVRIGEVVGRIADRKKDAAPETADTVADVGEAAAAPEAAKPDRIPGVETSAGTGTRDTPEEERPLRRDIPLSPSLRRLAREKKLDPARAPVPSAAGMDPPARPEKPAAEDGGVSAAAPPPSSAIPDKEDAITRTPMSPIRKRIAERLLAAKQNTAMLTTFNEIDMHRVIEWRTCHKARFTETHAIALGFMSFFIKACVYALQEVPAINAFIEDGHIIHHRCQHIGVAVGSERGLVVPVLRHAEKMSFADIEKAIADYVDKIAHNRLAISDLEGGTFTVSNGGIYGSLLSTPILNTPQSGILGMHKIQKRPVVVDEKIVIRPMMYVALSYDHRIVDGKEAVTFLRRVKERLEAPERLLLAV